MKKEEKKMMAYEAPGMEIFLVCPCSCIATSSLNGSTGSYGESTGAWSNPGTESYEEQNGSW